MLLLQKGEDSMAHTVSHLFSPADLERVKAAVHEAEKKTSGEIVPYVVDRSDEYEEAEWRCGALLGTLTHAAFAALHRFTAVWLPLDFAEVVLVSLLAFLLGMGLARFLPPVKRLFAGSTLLQRRVALRAADAFIGEEVFRTRDRTGILLFLSVLEHKVLVIGDAGINAKVDKLDWQDVANTVVAGIRSGKPASGLIEAIGKCGNLLERHNVGIKPDDTDELPDNLRIRER
jgi:putative membrane protein